MIKKCVYNLYNTKTFIRSQNHYKTFMHVSFIYKHKNNIHLYIIHNLVGKNKRIMHLQLKTFKKLHIYTLKAYMYDEK